MPATQASPGAGKLRWAAALAAAIAALGSLAAAPAAPAADVPALDTSITGGPAEGALINELNPTFSFEATLAGVPFPGATFRCSVDNAPAEPCASPFQTAPLEDGAHSFSVFAEDLQHVLADPTPARRTFSVGAVEGECEVFEDEEGSKWKARNASNGERGPAASRPRSACCGPPAPASWSSAPRAGSGS